MLGRDHLSDLIGRGLDIVFAGTAAGTKSAAMKAYYAGDGNKFYDTLYRIGLTPEQLKPEDYEKLREYRVGLTDLAKHASGPDNTLSKTDFDIEGFRKKIEECQPKILAFNGKKAAKVFLNRNTVNYGIQDQTIGKTKIYVLPSTSGMASRWWDQTYWKDLAKDISTGYL
jgi:TDG/mug DNA glycosylase family protein